MGSLWVVQSIRSGQSTLRILGNKYVLHCGIRIDCSSCEILKQPVVYLSILVQQIYPYTLAITTGLFILVPCHEFQNKIEKLSTLVFLTRRPCSNYMTLGNPVRTRGDKLKPWKRSRKKKPRRSKSLEKARVWSPSFHSRKSEKDMPLIDWLSGEIFCINQLYVPPQ